MAKKNNQNELSKKHIAHSERVRRQQRWVIIGISAFAALVILVLGFGVFDQNYLQGERAVARVGDEKVTVSEFRNQTQLARLANVQQFNYSQQIMEAALQLNDFESYLQAMYDLQRIQSQMSDANEFALNYLNAMIDDVLIRKEAGNFDPAIVVSDAEVDESLQRLFNYFPNGTPTAEPTVTLWVTPTFSRTQVAILGPTKTALPTATLDLTLVPSTTPTQAPTSAQPPTATPAVTLGPLGTPTAYTQEGYQVNFQKYLEILAPYGVKESDLREYWKTQLPSAKSIRCSDSRCCFSDRPGMGTAYPGSLRRRGRQGDFPVIIRRGFYCLGGGSIDRSWNQIDWRRSGLVPKRDHGRRI